MADQHNYDSVADYNEAIADIRAEGGRVGYNRGRVVNPGGYGGFEDLKNYAKDSFAKAMYDEAKKTQNPEQFKKWLDDNHDNIAKYHPEYGKQLLESLKGTQRLNLAKELDMTDKEGYYGFREEVPSQRFEDIREWMGSKKRDPDYPQSWEDLSTRPVEDVRSAIERERDYRPERYEDLENEQLKRIYDISKRITDDTEIATAAQGGLIGYFDGGIAGLL
jgi:hypothetical protein